MRARRGPDNWLIPGGLILLSVISLIALSRRPGVTGVPRLDASLGILLGLYVSSRGAGRLLDAILYDRYWGLPRARSAQALWVALHLLILLLGSVVVAAAATWFARG